MKKDKEESTPNISGVPKEVQENIVHDLAEKAAIEPILPKHRVGISVSENEDLAELGYSNIHLRDLTIEIARHLIINGSSIVYGGDLRKEGYTEIFSDLSYQYRSIKESKEHMFENYFAYPIHCLLTKQNELEFKKNKTTIYKVSAPTDIIVEEHKYIVPDSLDSKFIWAKSLTAMRNLMIENTNARILVGGKVDNYLGKMPGVIEEAKITIVKGKPLYLVGAFGGASKEVINALQGNGLTYHKNEFHNSAAFNEFKNLYNSKVTTDFINSEEDARFFSEYGMQNLSANNGLSVEENKRLFNTSHISEMLYYILKGLDSVHE